MVQASGCALHGRARSADQTKAWIEAANRCDDGNGQRRIGFCLVVKGAVRLDVAEHGAVRPRDRFEGAKLIDDQLDDRWCVQVLVAATEAFAIVEPRMCADNNAVLDCQGDAPRHGVGIASVYTAGNVHRCHERDHLGLNIWKTFADVGVQVDLHAVIVRGLQRPWLGPRHFQRCLLVFGRFLPGFEDAPAQSQRAGDGAEGSQGAKTAPGTPADSTGDGA